MPALTPRRLLAGLALLSATAVPGVVPAQGPGSVQPAPEFPASPGTPESLPQADEQTQAAIRGVIEQQLSAFRVDDGEAAFGYATPELRRKYETAERFMRMVRSSYPQVYRPERWRFHQAWASTATRVMQAVWFRGQRGETVLAMYSMERQSADGPWRIAGVVVYPMGRGSR